MLRLVPKGESYDQECSRANYVFFQLKRINRQPRGQEGTFCVEFLSQNGAVYLQTHASQKLYNLHWDGIAFHFWALQVWLQVCLLAQNALLKTLNWHVSRRNPLESVSWKPTSLGGRPSESPQEDECCLDIWGEHEMANNVNSFSCEEW